VAQVALDTSAVVNLNAFGIDVGSGGVTGKGIFINGVVHLQATATLNGVFDQVDIGQSGTCGSVAPMTGTLGFVSANNLNVYCRTLIDTTAAAALNVNIFPNAGGNGWLTINARGALAVSNNANFTGDSLYVQGGVISVNGSATMGGSRVLFGNGSALSVQGPAFFNATVGGDYTNAQIRVQGNVLVGGGVSGQQSFSGGYFQAGGNFTQTAGALSQTLRTSNDHRIQFLSSSPQVLSVASPASTFQLLEFNNGSASGVQLASDITIVNGTLQARVDVMRGKLNVTTGTTLSVGGGMLRLGTGANLNLNGNVANVSTCFGRTLNSATLSGTGLFNNAAYTAATCTP
jgi:hypothetical protein